jgi:hypothetical protein
MGDDIFVAWPRRYVEYTMLDPSALSLATKPVAPDWLTIE